MFGKIFKPVAEVTPASACSPVSGAEALTSQTDSSQLRAVTVPTGICLQKLPPPFHVSRFHARQVVSIFLFT